MADAAATSPWITAAWKVLAVLLLLFAFLVSIKGLGTGFKMLGKDVLGVFFTATENPFIGLVVGMLATTLVQSSSVTTSMIVAMVAAPENPLPIANAVPMIMGANIGTTVTNAIVALAQVGRKEEFRRSFAVAICHDLFNVFTVAILLPLEIATGFLQKLAGALHSLIGGVGGVTYESPIKHAVKVGVTPLVDMAHWAFDAERAQAVVLMLVSIGIIVVSLMLLVRLLRSVMQTRVETYLTRALGSSALTGIPLGMVVTASVQSSSITTSLLVPLAGAGLLTLRQAYPITLGANVGTTVTALLASLAVSGVNAEAGVQIALVHLFFNLVGIGLIYPSRTIRSIPIKAARRLSRLAMASRRLAIVGTLCFFYGVPALLIYISRLFD
jgi:sodium-dependent phosphate cotransporter